MHDQDCAARVLGLPDGHRVSIVLAIGPPGDPHQGRMQAPRAGLDELVHRERW
jgi:hypothetical protein